MWQAFGHVTSFTTITVILLQNRIKKTLKVSLQKSIWLTKIRIHAIDLCPDFHFMNTFERTL
jgi:hypothetical protein